MQDILSDDAPTLNAFTDFVKTERKAEAPIENEDWNIARAELLDSEAVEFMNQHGPGGILLAPQQYREKFSAFTEPYPEIKQCMADELSDLLWFSFDIAAHNNKNPGVISALAISSHINAEVQPATTFQDMQENVVPNAGNIRLPVEPIEGSNTSMTVVLAESPLQTYAAAHLRLTNILRTNPSTENDGLDLALGDYINILTYIAKTRLDMNIEDVARYNAFKLRDRKQFGKRVGHLFIEFDRLKER